MASPIKTPEQQLLSWQDVATGNTVISSPVDVATKISATVMGHIARRSGTAFTTGWPIMRFEASVRTIGDDSWFPLYQFATAVGTAIANTTLSATCVTGASSFVVVTSANIIAGDFLYLGDTTASNWEVVKVKSVSGNTITPEQPVQHDHASGAAVTDQAEKVVAFLDLLAVLRVRVVFENAGSGQTAATEIWMATCDAVE